MVKDNRQEKDSNEQEMDYKGSSDPKENTRSTIAKIYVRAYFGVVLLVFITGWCKCFDADGYKDLLIAVSGVLSGPLGFIVGYYFKASKE